MMIQRDHQASKSAVASYFPLEKRVPQKAGEEDEICAERPQRVGCQLPVFKNTDPYGKAQDFQGKCQNFWDD